MSRAVWDASTLLFVLLQEPGWEDWATELPESVMTTVNLSEVMTKIMSLGGVPAATREVLEALPIEVHDFSSELAFLAASLRRPTKPQGLSLGDRACLALGASLGLPVLTADRVWGELDVGVEISLVR